MMVTAAYISVIYTYYWTISIANSSLNSLLDCRRLLQQWPFLVLSIVSSFCPRLKLGAILLHTLPRRPSCDHVHDFYFWVLTTRRSLGIRETTFQHALLTLFSETQRTSFTQDANSQTNAEVADRFLTFCICRLMLQAVSLIRYLASISKQIDNTCFDLKATDVEVKA